MTTVADSKKYKKLKDLHDYLKNNQAYLVNYAEREQEHQTYISPAT